MNEWRLPAVMQEPARVAIDLGAESCRVSLLRWEGGKPKIEVVHRIPNGPVHRGDRCIGRWRRFLPGLKRGCARRRRRRRKALHRSAWIAGAWTMCVWPPMGGRCGSRSAIAMNGRWRRKKRRTRSSRPSIFTSDGRVSDAPEYRVSIAGRPGGGDRSAAPWVMMPEYILYWLGARRVSEYTHATHTGLVDLKTGDWSAEVFACWVSRWMRRRRLFVRGRWWGALKGPLAGLDAFKETQLIVPACHDTASAIAGIPRDLSPRHTSAQARGRWWGR